MMEKTKLPPDLSPKERIERFPDDPHLHGSKETGAVRSSSSDHYMNTMMYQNPTDFTKIHGSDNILPDGRSDSFMNAMFPKPDPTRMRQDPQAVGAYPSEERSWLSTASAQNGPVVRNGVLHVDRFRDEDRTWRFPKSDQVLHPHQRLSVAPTSSPTKVAVDAMHRLLQYGETDVRAILAKLEQSAQDFQPPELKSSKEKSLL